MQRNFGHIVEDNQLLVLQKNDKGKKITYIKLNFESQITEEVEYHIQDSLDLFVERFSFSDRMA